MEEQCTACGKLLVRWQCNNLQSLSAEARLATVVVGGAGGATAGNKPSARVPWAGVALEGKGSLRICCGGSPDPRVRTRLRTEFAAVPDMASLHADTVRMGEHQRRYSAEIARGAVGGQRLTEVRVSPGQGACSPVEP